MEKIESIAQFADELIFSCIYMVRGQKIILDADLAKLYNVEVRALKQSVRRNIERFPGDFMFQLTEPEWIRLKELIELQEIDSLRSQIVILERNGPGQHSKYLPFVFTEQGVAMLSSVLKSNRAVAVNIQIMRIFVRMRQMISNYADLLSKIESLEDAQMDSNGHISQIYQIIKELIEPAIKNRPPVGFKIPKKDRSI